MTYIGQNGIALDKKEGDKKTPEGIFYLGIAFGMNATIDNNKIEYKKINKYLYWVDDVNSKYYNQLVDSRNKKKRLEKCRTFN